MIRSPINRLHLCVMTMLVCTIVANAIAQQPDGATDPPPTQADAVDADKPQSLDDLLGLETDESEAEAIADRERQRELQQRLNEQEISDVFLIALDKMGTSAELLKVKFDSGLGTQRVQEEILAKLDQLIDLARRQQSESGSSSSSSQSQSQSQSPGQRQSGENQADQADGQRNPDPSDSQAGDPPASQDGALNAVLEEMSREWGNLPDRVRDELQQGKQDKYSSLYRRLTEEYYKRLAEGGSP